MKGLSIGGVLILALVSAGVCADSPKKESKGINGSWAATSAVLGGKAYSDDEAKAIHATFRNGKYMVKSGEMVDEGTYTLGETEEPKTVDVKLSKGADKGKT